MKKLFSILILINFCTAFLQAQVNNAGKLKIITQNESSSLKIRWMLTDYETWAEGNQAGYSVVRYTTHTNGVQLSIEAMQASMTVLADNILPLPETQWTIDFPDNAFAQVARGVLYEADTSVVVTGTPTLADAYNQVESNDTRFLFGHFAAEQDFAIAEGMALGYEDVAIDVNNTYLYRIVLNSTNPSFEGIAAAVVVKAAETTELPVVETPSGEGMDKAIVVQWSMVESSNYYSTYDIERSLDGTNFEKVNDLPFVFAAQGVDNPEFAAYKDEVDDNNTTYFYRVRGRTPFGTQGPPSETVALKGTPPRINLFLAFSDFVPSPGGVKLLWNNIAPELQSQVAKINIYRSKKSNKDFVKINPAALPPTANYYKDAAPLNTAYYKLEAIDINGYSYKSPSLLVQLNDEEPPAVPTGLSGSFITSSKLLLKWEANTEEDLKGYRLFVANKAAAVFTQITNNAVKDTQYVYEIDPQFMVDNIYIKILATDFRDNYSQKSAAIEVGRPDVVPPSKPVLFKAVPTPAGVELGFKFSTSEDRVAHELQMKPENTPDWQYFRTIEKASEGDFLTNLTPNAITSTNLILPNAELQRRPYQFRLVAIDDSGNKSSSQILTVRPYDSGKRGEIENFDVGLILNVAGNEAENPYFILDGMISLYETDAIINYVTFAKLSVLGMIPTAAYNDIMAMPPSAERDLTVYQLLLQIQAAQPGILSGYIPKVLLSWTYPSTDQLEDFQIFRSAEGRSLMLYKTIPVETYSTNGYYEFQDTDLRPGYRYFYQIMARHAGGGFSPMSEVRKVKVE